MDNFAKSYNMCLTIEFKYFTWNDLKKFQNILIFWTDRFSLK